MKEAGITYFTTERLPAEVGDRTTLTLQKMLDLKLLVPFTDKNGDNISLEDIKSENVVIIFHKTDCVLCQKAMRILSLIKKRNKNIEIIDINITDETSNKDIIHRYNLTNVPSIFVLDKDRRIICKNIKAEEVEFYLKRK